MTVHSTTLATKFDAILISTSDLWQEGSDKSVEQPTTNHFAAAKTVGLVIQALLNTISLGKDRIIIDGFPLTMAEARLFVTAVRLPRAIVFCPRKIDGL